ncbi:hypothetical protein H0O01_03600 [Candidatus Micrarchaeota archaeon]|nr:hypothetical protein [Candidatus Micrarchaeota archaeon]
MSKKKEIREMANLVGNSAAHIALLSDSEFALKEASTYTEDAAETASSRTWGGSDIEEFRELALKRASSEIGERVERYGLPKSKIGDFISRAEKYICLFAESHLEKKE